MHTFHAKKNKKKQTLLSSGKFEEIANHNLLYTAHLTINRRY
jgi:hypothetical protein